MKAVLRDLLAGGMALAICGCAGNPPPAVIEPGPPESPPEVEEVAVEPIVEVVPERVREPEPPLADRWRAPFAVSSSGRVMTRAARSVTVLDSDPAIAAGMAAVNDAPAPASASSGPAAAGASTARGAGAASTTRAPAGGVASAPNPDAAGSRPGSPPPAATANRGAATPPPSAAPSVASASGATASNRPAAGNPPPVANAGGPTTPPAPAAADRSAPATAPPANRPGNAAAPVVAGNVTRADDAPRESGVRLIGDPIEPEAGSAPTAQRGVAPTSSGGGAATSAPGSTPRLASSQADDDEEEGADRGDAAARSVPGPSARDRTYTVESGDSWIGIARDHGVSYSQLLEANPGANPERIRIGQVLRIPPSTRPAAARTHTVGRGDTLSEIAQRYGVSVRSLREENDLTSDVIRQGQVLRIPAD